MFSPNEIDAVLSQAQTAVDSLAQDVGAMPRSTGAPVNQTSAESCPIPGGHHILRIQVPIAVRLAEQDMALSEIMKLGPGTILEFNRSADGELDLMVNNLQIGRGVAVKVNERFGLRINSLGNVRDKLHTIAG